MASDLSTQLKLQLLDFDKEKSSLWEKEHKLYSVHFEITPNCNFNCVHCYLRDCHNSNQLSYNQILEILDILCDKGVLFITFTGGEIFARRDFIDVYMYAKRKGFIIELFTNGTLITPEIISVLKQYPPLLVDVSIYGACENTYKSVTGVSGMFDKVLSNCRKLCEAGVRLAFKSPLLTLNANEYKAMKLIADSMNIPFRASFEIIATVDRNTITKTYQLPVSEMLKFEFNDALSNSDSNLEKEELSLRPVNRKEEKPLFRCKIGCSSCVIDYNGNLCPCMKYKHVGKKIDKSNFDDIWMNIVDYSLLKASPSYKCLTCSAYNYCDICPAEMDFLHGNLEYIDESYCKIAYARKEFHENGVSIEDALSQL